MLLSCHHIPVPIGPTGNPNTQCIHISSYWDYVQSGTGLHKNTGLKETDPVELTWIKSPTPHLLTQNAHPGLPTPAALQWEVSLWGLSGWCIWRRALPHPRLTGRYSRAQTPVLSRACPASFWTPLSQSQSSCMQRNTLEQWKVLLNKYISDTHGRSSLSLSLAAGMKNE